MIIWLILAIAFAALETLALSKNWRRLEYLAKPAVVVSLFVWLYLTTGLKGNLLWFGIGILFSLVGDVLLMISFNRMFLPGLAAFLLAHLSYITGFQDQFTSVTANSILLVLILVVSAVRVIRRIVGAMRAKGEDRLVVPVIVYSTVISVMLFAAMSTIFDPAWKTSATLFVSIGAFLFYMSDVILAWNKFVTPITNGRIFNILAYHLGQIGLIAGIISQFG